MEKILLKEIKQVLDIKTNISNDLIIEEISTDSRKKMNNALFIPIKGEKFDGHDFIKQAFDNGAILTLSEKPLKFDNYIKVKNTLNAFHSIAKYYIDKFNPYRIVITGSTGKTSTKEMLFSCFENKEYVKKTYGNMNNLIGVPLNIFNIDNSTKHIVFEAGMNMKGELERLSYILNPDIVIITSINNSHIGNFPSFNDLILAKMEILKYMNNSGLLIINGDNKDILEKTPSNIKYVTFGLNQNNKYYPSNFILNERYSQLTINNKTYKINIPGIGGIYSFLSMYALYKERPDLPINPENVLSFSPPSQRMNIINTNNITIIDDTYNASPISMKNAIDVLSKFSSRKIAVLSDMLELGKDSDKLHSEIGNYLNEKNIDILISIGNYSKNYYNKFQNEKYHFNTLNEAKGKILSILNKNDIVLVKGSRAMNMEKITDFIMENENAL